MERINELLSNNTLGVAIVSWFMAQLFKVILTLWHERRFDLSKFISSGGMPSSHSAFVTALAIGIGENYGYNSPYFSISAVLGFIVMYDAANVRLQAGKQAAAINNIIEILENKALDTEERLKELLGHTPLQVLAGFLLGIVIGLIFFQRI